jgi:hypothetical protein
VAALAGVAWAYVLRAARPEIYARIGLGAKAATSLLSAPRHATEPERPETVGVPR